TEPAFRDPGKVVRTFREHLEKPEFLRDESLGAFMSEQDREELKAILSKAIDQILFEGATQKNTEEFRTTVKSRVLGLLHGQTLGAFMLILDHTIESLEQQEHETDS